MAFALKKPDFLRMPGLVYFGVLFLPDFTKCPTRNCI